MTILLMNISTMLGSAESLLPMVLTLSGLATMIAPILIMCGVGAASGVLLTFAA